MELIPPSAMFICDFESTSRNVYVDYKFCLYILLRLLKNNLDIQRRNRFIYGKRANHTWCAEEYEGQNAELNDDVSLKHVKMSLKKLKLIKKWKYF